MTRDAENQSSVRPRRVTHSVWMAVLLFLVMGVIYLWIDDRLAGSRTVAVYSVVRQVPAFTVIKSTDLQRTTVPAIDAPAKPLAHRAER